MRIGRSDSAVSNIVGAVLILALIITIAAAAKMVYVPDMKKEAESAHMQHAIDDLLGLKSQVDTLQAASASGNGFMGTSRLEMGGGALPVIDPSSSSGTVTVDPAYGNFSITAYTNNLLISNSTMRVYTRGPAPMGRLVYVANNHYYIDQQVDYEGGMIVLSQRDGTAMIASPPVTASRVANDPNTTAIVTVNPTRLIGSPQSFSSTTESTIKTTVLPVNNVINSQKVQNITIRVQSDHAQLWNTSFDRTMKASGLAAGTNYVLSMPDAHTVSLFIQGSGTKDDVLLSSIDSLVLTQLDGASQQITQLPPLTLPSPSPTTTPTSPPSQVPVAYISASSQIGTAPMTVNFQSVCTNSPASFDWNFGDGSPHGSGANVSHVYSTPGLYIATLIAHSSGGDSAPATVLITVNMPVPVASINASPLSGEPPLVVNFNGSGTNSPTSFDWTFGDGSNHGSGANVSHTYTTSGNYQVVLVAGNSGGNSTPVVTTISVQLPVPQASFTATPTSGMAPLTVNFQGSGTNSPTSFDWDFGDGSPHGSGVNPTHTYAMPGSYTVTLTASNSKGSGSPYSVSNCVAVGTGTKGIKATYYSDEAWTNTVSTEMLSEMKLADSNGISSGYASDKANWPTYVLGKDEQFSVRFTGSLRVDTEADYTFYLTSDDGSWLTIDGTQVIDNGGLHSPAMKQATIHLARGYHPLEVKMYEHTGIAVAHLEYSSSSLSRQYVQEVYNA